MADFTALKTSIQEYIKQNGENEITGSLLQSILMSMVETMGDAAINELQEALAEEVAARGGADATLHLLINSLRTSHTTLANFIASGYVFRGVATLATNPGTPNGKVFYLTSTAGQYPRMQNVTVRDGISALLYDGSRWSVSLVLGMDSTPTLGSTKMVTSGGVRQYVSAAVNSESARALAAETASVVYDDSTKQLIFKNANGAVLYQCDASAFVASDILLSVELVDDDLVMTFNTSHGEEVVTISLESIFTPDNYYTKEETDGVIADATDISATYSEDGKLYSNWYAGDIYYVIVSGQRRYKVMYENGTASEENPVEITGLNSYSANNSADAVRFSLSVKSVSLNPQVYSAAQKTQIQQNIGLERGAAGGVASLNAQGVIPNSESRAVSYEAQELTDNEKVQAQNNVDGRAYDTSVFIGMGKVILPKNIQLVGGVTKNLLTQDMFYKGEVGSRVPNTNTIFVIKYDFELAEDITIPANCVLEFDGGSMSGGTIYGNGCELIGNINIPITLNSDGNFKNTEWQLEWFGATPNPVTGYEDGISCATELQHCIDFIPSKSVIKVKPYNYLIDRTINVNKTLSVVADGLPTYVNSHFYNNNTGITLFKVNRHYCIFQGLTIIGSNVLNDFENYANTCFQIGDDTDHWDLITLRSVNVYRFMNCVILKANNTIFTECCWSTSVNCIILDTYTPNTSYQRNIQIIDNRFHSSAVCVRFNYGWSSVIIKGCDVNNCGCLAYNISGNANIICDNAIFNPRIFNNYDYIIESNSNVIVKGNNVHNASEAIIGFFKGKGTIVGNVLQFLKKPISITDTSIISNNYLFGCGSLTSEETSYPSIETYTSKAIITNNLIENSSNEVKKIGIQLRGEWTCICRSNYIGHVDVPIKATSASGSGDNKGAVKALSYYNNVGVDDIKMLPSMTPSFSGMIAFRDSDKKQAIWNGEKYIEYDGVNLGTPRIGDTKPTSDKIYRGFMFYDTNINQPVFAAAVGDTVTWLNIQGFSVTPLKGTTANRPKSVDAGGVLNSSRDIGLEYFDTDLMKPIYVSAINGSTVTWVDATGATV